MERHPLLVLAGLPLALGLSFGLPSWAEGVRTVAVTCPPEAVEEAPEPGQEELLSLVGHYLHEELPVELHVEWMDPGLRVVIPLHGSAFPLTALEEDLFCLEGAPGDVFLRFAPRGDEATVTLIQSGDSLELARRGW